MASIGSHPSSLIESMKGYSPSFPHVYCSQSPLVPNGNACKTRVDKFCNRRVMVGLSLVAAEKGKGLRAVQRSGGVEGQNDEDDDDEGIANDALRETIKQSKKVLAVQRDILQQIVERRKLISPLQSNIVITDPDTLSIGESYGSLPNLDQSSIVGQNDEEHSDTQSTDDKLSFDPSVGVNSYVVQGKKIISNDSQEERSLADALGLSRDGNLKEDKSQVISPYLSKVSEYGEQDKKIEGLLEEDVDGAIAKFRASSDEGNKDSPPLAGSNVMNVIVISAECAPWSKTGGLGDVAGALPKALARRGHRVMVVAPRYGNYAAPQEIGFRKRYRVDGQDMEVAYFHAYIDGVDFVFIDSPIFWHRESDIYGGSRVDILKRMVLLCKAAVEVPWNVPCGGVCYGDGNLAFIANDWHTALLPVYLKAYYRDHGFMKYARCVLVIHNIAHQGRGPLDDFSYVDLPAHYMDLFKLNDPTGGAHFNIFAAGLKTADRVVTVSHGYSWELKTSEGGWGLDGIINESDWKFHGIVNGIDTEDWNPQIDTHLKSDGYANYSLETFQTGKPQCKAALQRELGLQVCDDIPVLGFIGRLDHQKGVDLIAEATDWIVSQNAQLIMLGSGRQDLEEMLRRLEGKHRDKVRGWVGFSVRMAHRITAGADVILMPSRFEPCGLNQLYAMAYGTIPVVHAVGGLRDTVHPFDPYNDSGFGWTFDRAEVGKLIEALGHCFSTYRNYKKSWEGLQRRGMMQDLSWDNAAQRYEEVLVAAKYQW